MNAYRLRDAVDKLERSLLLDHSLAEASISRAMAFAKLGERENLQIELARADSLTGIIGEENRRMLAELRLSEFEKSRFRAMRDSLLTQLERGSPRNINVLVAQANDARNSKDELAQEQAWLRILEVDPNYADSYNMLGYMELNRGNYDQAIEYMKKYAFLAPDLANPHDSLGEVLMVLGRYEEAEAEFRTAVTMQEDFYHSLINLGKTYLARGQLRRGLDILEKVRGQVAGSDLELRVDQEIVKTYLSAGLDRELERMTAQYIDRYPKDVFSCLLRGVRLAQIGQAEQGKAVMDSSLASWRQSDAYRLYVKARQGIDGAGYQFEALAADAVGNPAVAAWNWQRAIEQMSDMAPHELWFLHYRLAKAQLAQGDAAAALAGITPLLATNPRLINVLVLKVKCHLALDQEDQARATLEQLQWSISKSDEDFPARTAAAVLQARFAAQSGS
jgi:tetratricopeptide (TPR) repeat protein